MGIYSSYSYAWWITFFEARIAFCIAHTCPVPPLAFARHRWPTPTCDTAFLLAQFFVIVLSFVCITSKPELRYGMTGMLSVLTASTFLYTSELFNSPFGIYAVRNEQRCHDNGCNPI